MTDLFHSNSETFCLNCGFMKSRLSRDDPPAFPHHLLTTNDPPSDLEVAQVQGILDTLHDHVSDLDASINDVGEILAKLRSRRKNTVDEIHRGRAILSVIRRLPGDVLGEIFSYTTPDESHRRVIDRSPWVLGRVCSQWRAISVSLSTLWSDVDSSLPLPVLMSQLERSKGCGLTIRLIYSETEALDPLIDCSTHWETVDIEMGVNMLPLLDRVYGKVPMLRHLKCRDSTGVGSCTSFQIAPNLSTVIINGKAMLRLPWMQLTRLRQRVPSIDDLTQLGSARNLVELSLTNTVSLSLSLARARELPEAVILELPLLRVLYIEDGEFLNFLLLPALENIYISKRPSSLAAFIDRSMCRLRKFTIIDPDVSTVIRVLDCASTVIELRLQLTTKHPGPFVSYLTVPSSFNADSRPPCPELRSLSLCTNVLDDHQSSQVVRMVESRLHSSACSSLSICRILDLENSKLVDYAYKTLDELRGGGIDAEWLPEKSARRRLIDWREEYV
ncbi:hypothetical protein MVEN_01468600 [Mycena venus]|uniref:F-box domain-containing protein n=1 Tax=Mycena venus TaxID=2733690 RepID=A0A8H7CSZ7_9AGAR|nr:hypothetical protein MVEN_01468600 [Mycena venus]